MFHNVVQVVPTENYEVYVYFEDGKIVCYNAKPLLEKKGLEILKNKDIFINTCTILNDTLAWDIGGNRDVTKCIDIDPDMLYELNHVSDKIAYNINQNIRAAVQCSLNNFTFTAVKNYFEAITPTNQIVNAIA